MDETKCTIDEGYETYTTEDDSLEGEKTQTVICWECGHTTLE